MLIGDWYKLLLESQWWPPERIVHYQREILFSAVSHARATSPYYRFRLNPLFRQDGSIEWNRWAEIPILSRADLSNHYDNILSRNPPNEHGPFGLARSSGSTGHPVTVKSTQRQLDISQAAYWRSHLWSSLDWSKTLLKRHYVGIEGTKSGDQLGPWGPPWLSRSKRGRSFYACDCTDAELLELAYKIRPDYVFIYTGSIDVLAELAKRDGRPLRLEAFLSRGEAISAATRQQADEVFGAKIIDLYSSQECGALAHPCPEGHGLHVNEEAALVEILRDDGTAAAPGEEGRVIVTPFWQTATPLIRYDHGDRAVAGGVCPCGRGLKLLTSILGRVHHAFRHPDGRVVFGARVGNMRSLISASRWQIAQTGPVHFEVRYVSPQVATPEQQAEFLSIFRTSIFEDATLSFTRVADFTFSRSGKFQEYSNEWSNPPPALASPEAVHH
jgi:phenylacetate-coenzyme A ligase PaaK-like adenylate-forming protein